MDDAYPQRAMRGEPDATARRAAAPEVVGLFPLADHVFLPGFPSPYRVFERRYRELVEDLLKR